MMNEIDGDEYVAEIKRITIPVDKLKEFIILLFGTEKIMLRENHFSITNILDLTNTNILIQDA
jgi:hypothetical protein